MGTSARRLLSTALVAALLPLAGLGVAVAEEAPDVSTAPDGTLTYADPALAEEDTTRVRGTLQVALVEPLTPDSRVEEEHALAVRTDAGEVVPIALEVPEEDPHGLSGGRVVAELVDSPALDDALGGEPLETVAVQSAELAPAPTASAVSPTAHRAYVAVVTNSGTVSDSATIEADVDSTLAWWIDEAGPALSSFSRSGTTQRFSSSLPTTAARCGLGESVWVLWDEAAKRFGSVNFNLDGNHLVVVVAASCGVGGPAGVGTIGNGMASGGLVTVVHERSYFASAFAHELGHNVGLEHANLTCSICGATQHYRDVYNVMGFAIKNAATPALGSAFRRQLGLIEAGEAVTVTGTTSVSLARRGASSGLRGVRVVDPASGDDLWVEWRGGQGRDTGAFYTGPSYFSSGGVTYRYPAGVTVTRQDPASSTPSTTLLARGEGTTSYGSYAAGQQVTVGGVTVAVTSIDSASARVAITVGTDPLPLTAATPTITGTPRVGTRLDAVTDGWTTGTAFTYQWRADLVDVPGATSSSFVPSATHRGQRISVRVQGTKAGHRSETRTSAQGVAVAAGTLSTSKPTISGTVKVGRRLTAKPGTWTSGTSLTYRWYANGSFISKATGSTFKLTSKQRGKRMTVRVTGRKAGYTTASRTSARTVTVKR